MILKKNTIRFCKKGRAPRGAILLLGLMGCFFAKAQVQNNGNLYIGEGATFYVASGNFNFGAGSKTSTSQGGVNNGKLWLSGSATMGQAASDVYMDGYIQRSAPLAGNNDIVFYLGQESVFAPIGIQGQGSDLVRVGFGATPNPLLLDGTLSEVFMNSWDFQGSLSAAVVELQWGGLTDIALSGFVADVSELTIAAYSNSGEWVELPSIINAGGNLEGGSISTISSLDFTQFAFVTFGAKPADCSPDLVAPSGATMVWQSVTNEFGDVFTYWSPSPPTLADIAVINAPYSGGDLYAGEILECNSLVLNADMTLSGTQSVEIVNGVTGTGKIIMSEDASVIQRASGANPPNVEITKVTGLKRRYDYIYWGTPIQGDFFQSIGDAYAVPPGSPAGAFDLKYKYASGTGGGWQTLTQVETGKGFITRVKSQAPFVDDVVQMPIEMTLDGVANNGTITVPVVNNPAAPNGGTSHNLLANPYPSPIDAIEFLEQNQNIDGTVYLWTSSTAPVAGVYSKADYIAYNLAGSVVSSPGGIPFNGKIASGQGFKVKALTAGDVMFTNCMRLKGETSLLYRQAAGSQEHAASDRFKLNLTGSDGVFSQILVAYLPEATMGYDRMYDAGRNSTSTVQLYSIFEGDQRKLAINARPEFDDLDVVTLGVSKTGTAQETFTIGIDEMEGVFAEGQAVYLHDKLENTYHDFSEGPATFTFDTTSINQRFEVVYQNEALGNPDFASNKVMANIKAEVFSIRSGLGMHTITLFDMTGRLVAQYDAQGQQSLTGDFQHAQGVYIARITLDNGTIATKKLVTQY